MNERSAPTILILGANGRLGAAATRAFADAGWRVLAQARQIPAALPAGARALVADVRETESIVAQAVGARAVLYAVNPVYTRWPQDALPFARAGMDIARQLAATFLMPGNVYNFGEDMPELLRESTPQRPSTRKGRIRVAMEAELEARAAQGLRGVVLRAGDFFGAGEGTWLDLAIAKSLHAGRLVYPGPLGLPHAWAYVPDLARAFVALAEREGLPPFARFHFPGHTLTGTRLLQAIERAAREAGLAPRGEFRVGRMPWGLIRLAGLAVPMWRELAEMSYLWRVPHALDGTALREAVGELPCTPLEKALADSLRSLQEARARSGHGAPPPAGQARGRATADLS